jgi:catechol 2,3-dioxygenase-like lactoylglutathione lyase family enzyme
MLGDYDAGTALAVKDLEESKQFYGSTLGLEEAGDSPGGVQYKSGNTKFFIFQTEYAGTNKATYMGWNVDNIEQVVEDLKSKGVQFDQVDLPGATREGDILVWGAVKTAFFKDPTGNVLAINSGM